MLIFSFLAAARTVVPAGTETAVSLINKLIIVFCF
jgi:hypothetical protein